VVFFSQRVREALGEMLRGVRWSVVVKPMLVVLCAAKFFSFAWSPMSAGFGACYRSLYAPLEDATVCEKSYESPFLQGHGLQFARVSRVDQRVDFGVQPYDWSLPFMNEFPRLGALWMGRFSFSASYSARVSSEGGQFVPVRAIGELSVSVDGREAASVVNYDRHFLAAAPLPNGESELLVSFTYADAVGDVPDSPPAPRGPYAQLLIGKPMTATELRSVSRVLITSDTAATGVAVQDRDGNLVEEAQSPPPEEGSLLRRYAFDVSIPATALERAPLQVTGKLNGRDTLLATITANPASPFQLEVTPDDNTNLSATLTAERDALTPMTPGARTDPSLMLTTLLAILDLTSLMLLVALAVALIRSMRSDLPRAIALAAAAWIAVKPLDAMIPGFAGGDRELVVPYAALSLFVLVIYRNALRHPLAFLTPTAVVLASHKVFEEMQFNHPGESNSWWGHLLYHWRDSDWFVAQGYGRTIFTESSLSGGESVFWFQSGPRYLAVFLRLMLGENDILIGLLFVTLGYLIAWMVTARFISENENRLGRFMAIYFLFILQIFIGDQLIVTFGFLNSSEYPTWLVLLGITSFLLSERREPRVWFTTAIATVTALVPHFRPNLLFVCFGFLVLIIMRSVLQPRTSAVRQIISATTGFVIVLPLSLVHNLYYGNALVPFAGNANINYAFNWTDIFQDGFGEGQLQVWNQLRGLLYWRVPHDPNFAIFFWGAQLSLLLALVMRVRSKILRSPRSLILLLPLLYILPMLKFQYSSYYPRHLVAASLLCMCSAMMTWPKDRRIDEFSQ